MKKTEQKKRVSPATVVAISAGVAALGAVSYYFFGPHGKKHRRIFKGWMIKMKGEIIEKLESAAEVTEETYHRIIDAIANAYVKSGKAAEADVRFYADQLKKQWKHIAGSAQKKGAKKKASKKQAKAPAKK